MKVLGNQLADFGGHAALLSTAGSNLSPAKVRTTCPPPAPGMRPVVPKHRYAAAGESIPPLAGSGSLFAPADDNASGRLEETGGQPRAGLAGIGHLLNAAALAAPGALAVAGYVEASEFAVQVEELARSVECLQLLAAGAVDRTRNGAITAAAAARSAPSRGWVTGWEDGVETLNETDAGWPGQATPVAASPADDGCRNTAEFLRLRLRIPLREARRRLALALQALPGTSLTGEPLPPARPHLASALAPAPKPLSAGSANGAAAPEETAADTGKDTNLGTNGDSQAGVASAPLVSSYAGTIITAALDRIRHHTTPDVVDRIEHDLTNAAAAADPDFVARLAQRWAETIDADGTEPTEEALRHTQGAFIRKPRHGLHRLEIFATTDQYEHLLTVMNAATNPRANIGTGTGTGADSDANADAAMDTVLGAQSEDEGGTVQDTAWNGSHQYSGPDLERRTRPQKQLDGIIGAVKAGLTTNALPITGGNRPQIIATINYKDLFAHRRDPSSRQLSGPRGAGGGTTGGASKDGATVMDAGPRTSTNASMDTGAGTATGTGLNSATGTGPGFGSGNFAFTGPVAAATLRKIACDADIIPAVLGTHGEILDLGRKSRLFTPAQRLALTARDQGCTFPNCTIPAPWCEAHHITYWSDGGATTTDNGALLCSAHHHLVHKEQWTIMSRHGTPWYTPPPHIDPQQKPQQNHYFRPPPPPQTQRE